MARTSALTQYIRDKHALGASRDEIIAGVSEYGGDAALVDEVLAEHAARLTSTESEVEEIRRDLLSKQSLILAILAGGAAALLSASVWATLSFVTNYQHGWVAVILGLLVAKAVKNFGQGIDARFRLVGLLSSLAGIFFGNAFLAILVIHRVWELPLGDAIALMGDSQFYALILEASALIDVVFYLAAAVCGWHFSVVPLARTQVSTPDPLTPMGPLGPK